MSSVFVKKKGYSTNTMHEIIMQIIKMHVVCVPFERYRVFPVMSNTLYVHRLAQKCSQRVSNNFITDF